MNWTRLSRHGYGDNQVRLQLFALAYNLAAFLRRLASLRAVKHWSLTTLREYLIKIGPKVVTHARYVTFRMAEVGASKESVRHHPGSSKLAAPSARLMAPSLVRG